MIMTESEGFPPEPDLIDLGVLPPLPEDARRVVRVIGDYELNIRDLRVAVKRLMEFRAESLGSSGCEFYAYVRHQGPGALAITAEDHGDFGMALHLSLDRAAPGGEGGPPQDGARSGGELADLLEEAWGVIANAGWDGSAPTTGWQDAAVRWRDRYFGALQRQADGGPGAGQPASPPAVADFGSVRLELMGHRYREGRLAEVVLAGTPFLRLEVADGSHEYYRPSAVCCLSPLTGEPAPRAAISARFGDVADEYEENPF